MLDASGTWSQLASQAAALRMQAAGVVLNSTVAVTAELQRDWRQDGGQQLAELYATHAIPFYGSLILTRVPHTVGKDLSGGHEWRADARPAPWATTHRPGW